MKLRMILALAFIFCHFSMLQAQEDLRWINPLKSPEANVVHGQGWSGLDYHRLPDDAENKVRKAVWNLSRHAAGVKLKFNTNAEEIKVKYVVSARQSMPHMPATGVSGLDLYIHDQKNWVWVKGVILLVIPFNTPFRLRKTKSHPKILIFTFPCTMRLPFLK